MRHPFDGLITPGVTRREALGTLAAVTAGLVGLTSDAAAQVAATDAIGENGGVQITTLAIGEEGGPTKAKGEEGGLKAATTEPFGEEAGKVTSRAVPGVEDGKAAATEAKGENGGPIATTFAVGEEGGPSTKALGEEGGDGPVTRARGETGMGPVVPVNAASVELKEDALKNAWRDLGNKDAAVGVQACAVLYGAKSGVVFVKDNLTVEKFKMPQADEKTITKLIDELDADTFKSRQAAEQELEKLGAAAVAAMEKTIKAPKSAEQRMRLERLIEKAKENSTLTQGKRALEVLVALRTPEARELLTKLSKGDDKEWLTQAAREALTRLPK